MYRVGIYAPYRRSGVTSAAAALADAAVRLGASVRWVSPAVVRRGTHERWDGKVRRVRENYDPSWVKGCDAVVWFWHWGQAGKLASELPRPAAQFFAAPDNHLEFWPGNPEYINIVKPLRWACAVPGGCPWSAGPPAFAHACAPSASGYDVLLCVGRGCDEYYKSQLKAAGEVLTRSPEARVTVARYCPVSRPLYRALCGFRRDHAPRVTADDRSYPFDGSPSLWRYDAVLAPPKGADGYGAIALTAASFGVPVVVTPDYAPYLPVGGPGAAVFGAVSKSYSPSDLADAVLSVLGGRPSAYSRIMLQDRYDEFVRFWASAWDLPVPGGDCG